MSQPSANSYITFTVKIDVPPLCDVIKAMSERTLNSTRLEKSQNGSRNDCTIHFEPVSFRTGASMHLTGHYPTGQGAIKPPEWFDAQIALVPQTTISLSPNSKITKATMSAASAKEGKPITEMGSFEWPHKVEYKYRTEDELKSIEDIPHTYFHDPTVSLDSTKISMGFRNVHLHLYDDENNRFRHDWDAVALSEGDITIGLEDEDKTDVGPRDRLLSKETLKKMREKTFMTLYKGVGRVLQHLI